MSHLPEGNYKVRAIASSVGVSSAKGTPYVQVTFRVLDGDHAGAEVDWIGYVTDKTEKNVVKDLRTLGYRGADPEDLHGLDEEAVAAALPATVSIKVEHEEFNQQIRARARWINPLTKAASSGSSLFAGMKAAFLSHPAEPAQPAARPGPIDRSKRPAAPPQEEEDAVPFLEPARLRAGSALPAAAHPVLCAPCAASLPRLAGHPRARRTQGGRGQSRALPPQPSTRDPAMPKKKPAPPASFTPTPRCDVCGTDAAPLTREPVEGIVCERCPDCKRQELVP